MKTPWKINPKMMQKWAQNLSSKQIVKFLNFLLPVEAGSAKMTFLQPSDPLKIDEKSMQKVASFPGRS